MTSITTDFRAEVNVYFILNVCYVLNHVTRLYCMVYICHIYISRAGDRFYIWFHCLLYIHLFKTGAEILMWFNTTKTLYATVMLTVNLTTFIYGAFLERESAFIGKLAIFSETNSS